MEEWRAGGYEYPLFTHILMIRKFTPGVAHTVKNENLHPKVNSTEKTSSFSFLF